MTPRFPTMFSTYTHSSFYRHDTGDGHPEHAGRLDSALEGVRRAGLAATVIGEAPLHADTDRMIARVHSDDYARDLDLACREGWQLFHSLDNPISPASYAAARTAVGIALTAMDDVWTRKAARRAFVVARPPGHHAERREAMGFCFFNTIACVAEALREKPGIDRVFILDWDVHHGNGTQHLFEDRDDVFYASIHRFPFYPGTGAGNEIGTGRGRGCTLNVPLSEGSGNADYLRTVETKILHAIDQFQPSAILISAGFDAHARDPLGGMNVSEEAFGEMTRRIVEAANRYGDGRTLSLLEGGYDREGLASSVAEHVNALNEE